MNFKQFEIDDVMKEHYRSARWTIAWLCLLLPFLSILFGFVGVLQGYIPNPNWWHSISDTYYANSKAIMIGILSITTFYFATYKGYDVRDRIVNCLSALFAAGVALFPNKGVDGLIQLPYSTGNLIHCICAVALYATFLFNCFWLFRLGGSNTKEKKIRNRFYFGSGIGIVIATIFIFGCGSLGLSKYIPNYVWVGETIAQISYAIAWFVKSGRFIIDKK